MVPVVELDPRFGDGAKTEFEPSEFVTPDFKASKESPLRRVFKDRIGADKDDTKTKAPGMPRAGVIAKGVGKFYTMLGLGIGVLCMPCGTPWVENSDAAGEAWEELARKNPKVRAALLKALEVGDIGALVAVHLPMMTQVIFHHTALGESLREKMGQAFAESVEQEMKQQAEAENKGEGEAA